MIRLVLLVTSRTPFSVSSVSSVVKTPQCEAELWRAVVVRARGPGDWPRVARNFLGCPTHELQSVDRCVFPIRWEWNQPPE